MKKLVSRIITNVCSFAVSVFLLLLIPKVDNGKLLRILRRSSPFSVKIRFMLRSMPGEFILMVILIILLLLAVWTLFRTFYLISRLKKTPSVPADADETESALGCDHKTGRDRYLEQLENYLESGVIDRDEFNSMRERYLKQNIPDDYHG